MLNPQLMLPAAVHQPNIQVQQPNVLGGVQMMIDRHGQNLAAKAMQGDQQAAMQLQSFNPMMATKIQQQKQAQEAQAAQARQSQAQMQFEIQEKLPALLANVETDNEEQLAAFNDKMSPILRNMGFSDEDSVQSMADVLMSKGLVAGGLEQSDIVKLEQNLRKEYLGESKAFKLQNSSYSRILASAKDPSAAGDMAMIFNYMKLLDPGSTVREGEFATAQNATNVEGRVVNLYNNLLKGTRLSDPQRQDFLNRAGMLFEGAGKEHKGREDYYTKLSSSYKLNPENVVPSLQTYDIKISDPKSGDLDTLDIRNEVTGTPATPAAPKSNGMTEIVAWLSSEDAQADPDKRRRVIEKLKAKGVDVSGL